MLCITSAGHNYVYGPGYVSDETKGLGKYFLLVLKSAAYVEIHGQKNEVGGGNVVIFGKEEKKIYSTKESELMSDWIEFDAEESFFEELNIPVNTIIPYGNVSQLSLFVKLIACELYSNNTYKDKSCRNLVEYIFYKISESINMEICEEKKKHYEVMSEIRARIYGMPYKKWSIADIAAQCFMSKTYFQHIYKKTFGVTCISDVINSRIEHAIYYLTNTEMTVKSISDSCGYENEVHFLRQFKAVTGKTPTEYRAEMSEKKN